jgi:3-deoxy-D-manno-octulosonic-acid transferase
LPAALLRLAWRARKQRGYLLAVGERLGRHSGPPPSPLIWVHAVSVGETRAAAPIIAALRAAYPRHRILLTHMTPTGRETGRDVFGDTVERAWLPYDVGFAVRRFVRHWRPEFGVLLETEVWPRLLDECRRHDIPVMLVNARLSERSARRYARWPALARWAFGNLDTVAAQAPEDARRFEALGAHRVTVTGNVKFDIAMPADAVARGSAFRHLWGANRPVYVAGSTREGEESLLLAAFAARAEPDTLLVIVPRHPQRFEAVASLAAARGFEVARRSQEAPVPASVRVVIGDSMGEMPAYYAAADVVIMGGSFLPYGSQNLIEPCALGRPVVLGPSTFNFEEAARGAMKAGAAIQVPDAPAALEAAVAIMADAPRRGAMGEAGRAFVAAHQGAVQRLAAAIAAMQARRR